MENALRTEYEMMAWAKKWAGEYGVTTEQLRPIIREHRRRIRQMNRNAEDRLEKSLQDEWRHSFSEDGENGYDYGIFSDDGETEEDIREYVENSVGYPEINSPYDCTGRRFTCWIHVRRVPMGFAVIHCWGLDV